MASLAAIRALAEEWLAAGHPLDILVNNAGLMLHERTPSADGYETNVRAAGHGGPPQRQRLLLLTRPGQPGGAAIVDLQGGLQLPGSGCCQG
jgi:NAD(P)-dependent dehydrogenase (short-subunit alcohol dehydrogenase family)